MSRLGQWGPARGGGSSPETYWQSFLQRPILTRVGLVILTTFALTLLAYFWGLPLPYREGEVWAHDVRSRVDFEIENEAKTEEARKAALDKLTPEQRHNTALTNQVRRAVPLVMDHYPAGAILIQHGQVVTDEKRELLRAEAHAYQKSQPLGARARRMLAIFLVMSFLGTMITLYVIRYQPALAQCTHRIGAVCALVFLTHLSWLALAQPPWHGGLLPLTVTAMILAIAYRPQFALLVCFSLSIALTASRGNGMDHLLVQIGGQAVAILLTRNVRTRTQIIQIGVGAGLGYLAMTVASSLLTHQTWPMIMHDGGRRFLWGLLAGFLVSGCLPIIERCFKIVTDVSLMELADGSHDLLQEMKRRAPGTFNHSMSVANLAEQAAEAIGSNGLLTRVGAYFHDIGKMLKPHYFIENQSGSNLHDTLEPGLSTLIIIGHVKDGVALAHQYRLPEPIVDFIQQHHGTTLVEYFYRAALKQQEEHGHAPTLSEGSPCSLESSFRYPGPKPQTREAAVVMLTDAVESSSRALSDPTPSSLRKLVRDLLMKRLLDGQFEESGLTLTELHKIEESLGLGLIALYHSRIKYPDAPMRRAA